MTRTLWFWKPATDSFLSVPTALEELEEEFAACGKDRIDRVMSRPLPGREG